jgi:hypothetical protein
MGTHPLAGVYKSKEDFLKNTFERLDKVLKRGVIMKVDHTFVSGNIAVVVMTSCPGDRYGQFYTSDSLQRIRT